MERYRQKDPEYAFIKYSKNGASEDRKKGVREKKINMKLTAHMSYPLFAIAALLIYSLSFTKTGELNPIKQYRTNQKTEYLSNQIFRPYGLADTNKDGVVSLIEKAEAYTKMGF